MGDADTGIQWCNYGFPLCVVVGILGEINTGRYDFDAAHVENCVRRSRLSERYNSLPEGINTYLYKDFDEPTAALDPVSEHDIYTKFNEIVGTRTAIYISHRLSSCRFCDEITVMEDGRIAERGSH